jgi:hypothetical protein
MLDVEREAFLRAVGPYEVRRQAAHARVVGAREIAAAGPLDLDDACAEIGELAGAERCGDRVLERHHGDAVERPERAAAGLRPGRRPVRHALPSPSVRAPRLRRRAQNERGSPSWCSAM